MRAQDAGGALPAAASNPVTFSGDTATLLSLPHDWTSLTINSLNNAGQTFDMAAVGPFTLAGPITGGTLLDSATPDAFYAESQAALNGVTIASPLNFNMYGTLYSTRMTLADTSIHIGSAASQGYSANVVFGTGAQGSGGTLDGTGQVLFGGKWGASLTFGPGSVVGSGISIANDDGDGTLTFMGDAVNHASITATTGHRLTLDVPKTWQSDGAIRLQSGSTFVVGTQWPLNYLGNVQRDAGATVVYRGLIGGGSGMTVDLAQTPLGPADLGASYVDGVTLMSTGRPLTMYTTDYFYYGGNSYSVPRLNAVTLATGAVVTPRTEVMVTGGLTFANGVNVSLSSSVTNGSAGLSFSGTQTLGGSGSVTFDGGGGVDCAKATDVLTIGPNVTVRTGTGGGDAGYVGKLVNQGVISAETSGQVITVGSNSTMAPIANSGTIRAINGGILQFFGPPSGTGTLFVGDGSQAHLAWASIHPADLAAFTLGSGGSAVLAIDGDYFNDNATTDVSDGRRSIHLGPYAYVTGGTLNSSTGDPLVIDSNTTFIGPGSSPASLNNLTLAAPLLVPSNANLSLVGVSVAAPVTVSHGTLSLKGAWQSSSTIGVTSGGTLNVSTIPANLGAVSLQDSALNLSSVALTTSQLGQWFNRSHSPVTLSSGSTLDNTGATLVVDDASAGGVTLYGGTITGGVVKAATPASAMAIQWNATLDGVDLKDVAGVLSGPVTLKNAVVLDGASLSIASATGFSTNAILTATGAASVSGSGTINFDVAKIGVTTPSVISVDAGASLTIGDGVSVQSGKWYGLLRGLSASGKSAGAIINGGSVIAGAPGRFVPQNTTSMTVSSGTFTNNGLLSATAGGTLKVADAVAFTNFSAGTLTGGRYQVDDKSTLDLGTRAITTNAADVTLSGAGSQFAAINSIATNAGGFTLTNGRAFATSGDLSNGGPLTVGGATSASPDSQLSVTGALTNGGSIVVVGQLSVAAGTTNNGTFTQTGGTATLGPVSGTGSLSVAAGTLTVASFAQNAVTVGDGGKLQVLQAPTVATNTAGSLTLTGSGTLDLANHHLLVNTTDSLRTYVARAAGTPLPTGLNAWTGTGLTSSVVAADAANGNAKQLALGYFDSRDNGNTGLSIPAGQTLVRTTVYGDATGDGKVSIADLSVWNNNFGASTPRWSQGDFNYDGKVNIADLSVWNNDFGNDVNKTVAGPTARAAASAASAAVTLTSTDSASPAVSTGTLEMDVISATGDVTLVSGGVTIAALEIDSAAGHLIAGNWSSMKGQKGLAQWSNPRGTPNPNEIAEFVSDPTTASGQPVTLAAGTVIDYGNILPSGFADGSDLTFTFNQVLDTTLGTTASRTGNIVFVSSAPEPTGLGLAGVAAVGVLSRKRRVRSRHAHRHPE